MVLASLSAATMLGWVAEMPDEEQDGPSVVLAGQRRQTGRRLVEARHAVRRDVDRLLGREDMPDPCAVGFGADPDAIDRFQGQPLRRPDAPFIAPAVRQKRVKRPRVAELAGEHGFDIVHVQDEPPSQRPEVADQRKERHAFDDDRVRIEFLHEFIEMAERRIRNPCLDASCGAGSSNGPAARPVAGALLRGCGRPAAGPPRAAAPSTRSTSANRAAALAFW